MTSPGYCNKASIQLSDSIVTLDMFVLSLGNIEVVLGVNWLQMLGVIQWDFNSLHMKFRRGNKMIEFYGIHNSSSKLKLILQYTV